MTRMAEEHNSILHMQAKINSYDEMEENMFENTPANSTNEEQIINHKQVVFCAGETWMLVQQIASLMSMQVIPVSEFTKRLIDYLRDFEGEHVTLQELRTWGVSLSTFEYIELCRLISWLNLLGCVTIVHCMSPMCA